jgi:cell wall-associated NlpC family hydrolase
MKKLTVLLFAFFVFLATTSSAFAATTTTQQQQADKVVNYALSLKGKVQYQWGKRDPSHLIFDCSSFTQYVFKQTLNKYMGWGANAQTHYGPKISTTGALKRGDLVMFSVGTPGKIGHVGIYMGNGKFVHNLSPKANVVISDLTTGYWKRHFIQGTRIIN